MPTTEVSADAKYIVRRLVLWFLVLPICAAVVLGVLWSIHDADAQRQAREQLIADAVRDQHQKLIEQLDHNVEMRDAYNRDVLGLKGAAFDRAHLKLLQEEKMELQKAAGSAANP